MEHFFTTYVRTKTIFQQRLKDLKTYDTVKIYMYELKKLGVKGNDLFMLRETGEIWYDDDGNFKALKKGKLDIPLLEKTRKWDKVIVPLTPLHEYMKKQLFSVTIDEDLEVLPVYFRAFMTYRKDGLDPFFSVDSFSGRIHTPVVNLKGNFRSSLRLKGSKLCSLDVKQMQPTILASILKRAVGRNPFSNAIDNGRDIYLVLLEQNITLKSREEAKKFLYQLIFGKPMNDIGNMFRGDTEWVNWINTYKSNLEKENPHGRETHTNLAWLLQSQEVRIMSEVWKQLWENSIPFLTIHDELLIRKKDVEFSKGIFKGVLEKHFNKFEITKNCY